MVVVIKGGRVGDPIMEPGFDPNVEPGFDPNVEPGFDPKMEPEFDPKVDPGFDPKVEPGFDPNMEPEFDPKADSGFDPNAEPPFGKRGCHCRGAAAGADDAAAKPVSPKEQSPSLQTVPSGHWEHGRPVISMERPIKLPAGP